MISIVDLILRNNHYKNAAHTPAIALILTLATVALVFIGGELGGRLVYRRRIGVAATHPSSSVTDDS